MSDLLPWSMTRTPPALPPSASDRFDHPHPDTTLNPFTPDEDLEFAMLSSIEDLKVPPPTAHLSEVVGVVLLRRRRFEGDASDHLVAQELPTWGVVTEINGHVGWLAKGLKLLDRKGLEGFSRKSLELFRAVTREDLTRSPEGRDE